VKPKLSYCTKQINRLGRLSFAREMEDSDWKELAVCLRDECASEEHAEAVITIWLREGGSKVPSQFDLVQIARRTAPTKEIAYAALDCPHCRGAGWESITVMRNGMTYEGSSRCHCGGSPRGNLASQPIGEHIEVVLDGSRPAVAPKVISASLPHLETPITEADIQRVMAGRSAE
jgi:hypothetical protein